jgi:hypothetical protein
MPDQSFGRRQSDQVVIAQGVTIAEHGVTIKTHSDEIEKFRAFKHEMNNFTQKLAADVDSLLGDMKTVVGLSERVSAVEKEQAVHTAKCDERYADIAEYMRDSKEDRKAIKQAQDDTKNTAIRGVIVMLLTLLGATCTIIGALIWRFGLPPMGN